MLIRSQNKKILIDMANLVIGLDKSDTKVICFHTAAMDGEASALLGEYSTTEKAVRVISMIQDAYKANNKYQTLLNGFNFATTITKSDNISTETVCVVEKSLRESYVFQMPRDEGVEV